MANTTGKKYGGREKGTPNRLTKELRTILKDVLYNELEKIAINYIKENSDATKIILEVI